jgi:hypothetical protein
MTVINYWCKWSLSIYGWKYLWSWMNFNISQTLTSFFNYNQSNEDSLKEFLDISNNDILKVNWNSSVHFPAYILCLDHRTKNIVLSIRGTMSLYDIMTDLNAKNCEFKPFCKLEDLFEDIGAFDQFNTNNPSNETREGTVHGGFLNAANNIYNDVYQTIINTRKNPLYVNYGLRIVGHSLGGAVAQIISFKILSHAHDYSNENLTNMENMINFNNKLKCYSFGPPPIFCKILSELHKDKIVTIVNQNDMIPCICLTLEQRYLPGRILHYTTSTNGKITVERQKEYFVTDELYTTSFIDHMPNRYDKITQFMSD